MKKIRLFAVITIISMFLLAACNSETADNGIAEKEIIYTEESATVIGTGGENIVTDQTAKIIRNVTIDGETKDFDSAVSAVKSQTSQQGGYIENSEIRGGESLSGGYRSARTAEFVIRIPADKLDSFLAETEGMLNITASTESTTDVTLDYYDMQSRLDTLTGKKAALETMLEKAVDLNEILTIQNELYAVIADIESYQSRLNVYDNKVNYSTVDLYITEVVEFTVIEDEEPSFGDRISKAFKESWENFGEFCQDFVVFIVSALPVLMFPAIALVIILIIWVVRKHKEKKTAEKNKEDK